MGEVVNPVRDREIGLDSCVIDAVVCDGNPRSRERCTSNFGHTSTVPAVDRQKVRVVLRRFPQLNDGKMFAPGQVGDTR